MENLSVEKYAIFNFFSHYFHTSMEGTTEKWIERKGKKEKSNF